MSLLFKNTPFLKKNTLFSKKNTLFSKKNTPFLRKVATNFTNFDLFSSDYYKKCKDCKYSMNNCCTLFKYYTITTENHKFDYYIDTTVARNDNNLCGPYGK